MSPRLIAAVVAVLAIGAGVALLIAGGKDEKKTSTTSTASSTIALEDPAPFTPNLPFHEPPVIKTQDGPIELVARNGSVEVSGVEVQGAQSYVPAGAPSDVPPPGLLGPTLQVEPGEKLDITFDNQLTVPDGMQGAESCVQGAGTHDHGISPADFGKPQLTNLHFHGLHVTPTTRKLSNGTTVFGDNVLVNLPKGKSRIQFGVPPIPGMPTTPKAHEPGTFWYHAHRHGCTDDQVFRGLAGLLIIGDSRKELPARFRNVETRLLALKDIQLDPDTGSGPFSMAAGHFWGDPTHRTVNGLVNPKLTIKPRETQLWRLANVSDGVWYEVALVDESNDAQDPFTVVAQDGNTLEQAQKETSVVLGPGMRKDILVVGPDSGQRVLKTLAFDQGNGVFPEDVLATVDVEGAPSTVVPPPGPLRPLPPFPKKRGENRTFTFDIVPQKSGPPDFTINGKIFDPDPDSAPLVEAELGTTETWTLLNKSTEWHPIHIHQDDFKVTSVNDQPVNNYGQQDVVPLPPMKPGKDGKPTPGKVVFEMPFEDFDGKFVIHCHILDHEDLGMMGRVDLSPPAPP